MDDQTIEIARAKVKIPLGPHKVTCSACGERYWPDKKEEHLANDCFPRKFHINEKPTPPPPGGSAGERWRLMKTSSITPAERKSLGLRPRHAKKSHKKKS
ncbi:MAG TPA: hypothetical protein VGH42_14270 [Verrucomicrobiae bacterium]|jgi:hypothetical protein